MNDLHRTPLSGLVDEVLTWNPVVESSDRVIHYVDISSIDRESRQITSTTRLLGQDAPSRARQLISIDDVLVSTVRPNLNAVAQVPYSMDGATASTGFCVLRSKRELLDPRYLYHWVKTKEFVESMMLQATGASYPAVTDRIVKASQIPLPPLPEQRRIAAILDAADGLRAKRRAALGKLEALGRGVFLEMFGERVGNTKGWPEAKLADLADIVSGVTKGQRFNGKPTVFAPYMRVANVQDGQIDLTEVKTIEALESDVEKYRLQIGDILLTEGGDPDKLGRGAIWHGEIENCIHQNHIFRVRLTSDGVIPEYVSALIGSQRGKRYFLRAAKQTTGIATINKTQLGDFPVLLPPRELQEQYKQIIAGIERSKECYAVAMKRVEELFGAVQQRGFRGEL